ncbi:TetR family transcriptional regulator [Micromonospora sp. WMMD882]|uniref:TetR/AcrR family transcriptional regulator n=1 Tax=Micromonospora sp. WMMD882 TaxID=3015151 RepID=UPI00248A9FB2|nr:TetR family transcriptional regulator [Micromonospora sp. WMMD882]WBB78035.1 TetR family transcriptional regulator [Micromonospora sp. WMMD882]
MPARSDPDRSVTERARRAQIVAATIETIAELGYRGASFAEIARRAGLSSTGLISYHFAGKAELMGEVLAEVHRDIGGFMAERVGAQPDPPRQLRSYITGMVDYLDQRRAPMRALLEIFLNTPIRPVGSTPGGAAGTGEGGATGPDSACPADPDSASADADQRAMGSLAGILAEGQRRGDFRDFDLPVMAMTIQRALDMLPFALAVDPGLDLALCARELTTLFDLGTRRAP